MPHLMAAMIPIQPGSPAACTFLALASLTAIAAVIVIAGNARTWLRENDPRRHDDDVDGTGRS